MILIHKLVLTVAMAVISVLESTNVLHVILALPIQLTPLALPFALLLAIMKFQINHAAVAQIIVLYVYLVTLAINVKLEHSGIILLRFVKNNVNKSINTMILLFNNV